MRANTSEWFETAKSYDLPSFLEGCYGIEVNKSKKCLCPFHDDTHPTMSLKETKNGWMFNCFACGAAGDITKFVELYEKVKPIDAVKKILHYHGIDVDIANANAEQQETTKAQLQKRKEEAAKKKEAKRKKEEAERKRAVTEMTKAAKHYSDNLVTAFEQSNLHILEEVELKFANVYGDRFNELMRLYLGWDYENECLCILNRDKNGTCYNIKSERRRGYFKKWIFGAQWVDHTFPGKWISWKNATTRPFGIDVIDPDDSTVFIVEGEKDALNLMFLGFNALTLGGVTTSWEPFRDILDNRDVVIWFDNDEAGYINAIKRYKEIESVAKSCYVVLFYKIGSYNAKYDVSDFIHNHSIVNPNELRQRIVFSSFNITNTIIDDIAAYLNKNLDDLKTDETMIDFDAASKIIVKNVKDVRGERDNEVSIITHLANQLKSSTIKNDLQRLINSLFPENSAFLGSELAQLEKIVHFKRTLLNAYRQTHIYDMVKELERATKSAGFFFAKYRDQLYLWTGTHYQYIQPWQIEDFVMKDFFTAAKIDFKKQTVKTRDEVILNIKGWAQSLEAWIDKEVRVINMRNGALIVRQSGKVTFRNHHDKKDCAMAMLDFDYDPNAKAPKWSAFLRRVLPDELDQAALMEFIGYCFLPSHKFEKFLLLYGATGANGKSVVLEVIRNFFSKENVSSLELHRFDGHELDALRNKIINIGSEIESGGDMRKQMAALKSLTSNKDTLTINPKNKDPYELYPEEKPKMAFATNKLIKSGADDGGVLRRMLLLHFDQEISDREKIRDLTERFKDEHPGILNMAIEGLQRLIRQNGFSLSEKRAAFIEEYKSDINPVRAYIKENLVRKSGVMVPKKFVYQHYRAWCDEKGVNAYAERTFWSKFKELEKMEEYRPRENKITHDALPKKPTFILNIAFDTAITEIKVDNIDVNMALSNYSRVGLVPVVTEDAS